MVLTVRRALRQEMAWINDRYDEAGFKRANFDGEVIAIAELDGERAGLGRLIKLDERTAELGGIYVVPNFRKQGVATKTLEFLLKEAESYHIVYCSPSTTMQDFYGSYGFAPPSLDFSISPDVKDKLSGYHRTTEDAVQLLVRLQP
ncbi:MAG TPA: GNAT family N-acetyltransferase [Trichocoleus sp.]